MNDDVARRVTDMRQAIEDRFGPGPLVFAKVTCDGCGVTVDALLESLEGWVGGPPDYCANCCQR